ADLREMEEMFHLELENRHGVLKVGFSQGIIVMMGIDYILSFTKKYPNFRMEIIEGPDKEIEDLVRTGAVDIGIMAAPTISSDFDSKPWCHFRCCAMMSIESEECKKIGEREVISISDLREHPIVLENKDFSIYREFNRICRENYDFEPEIFFETVEIDNALAIASKGYATAIVPVPVAENSKYHDLHTAELEEDLFWDWIFVKKKGSSVKEIEHAFIDHLTRKSKEMGWI
ncbi:MAG: LysR family transcriptional regulator substrate-binding protein, partial [Mogibacterium sp.]|nr:LysR family transcriptional regulator substrate-binding protein [Mogibacterium sp.]